MKKIFLYLTLLILLSCSSEKVVKETPIRVGIPPNSLRLFEDKDPFILNNFSIISLKPEERVTSLELLLFSTNSTAFDCILIESNKATLLKEWASNFNKEWAKDLRDEIKKPFLTEKGIYALPLTLDFPVFVYRKDIFEKCDEPKTLGILKDDIISLRRRGEGKFLLLSSVDEEILFLSLLASEMGIVPDRFYNYHSVKLLTFFNDFYLLKIPISKLEISFIKGDTVASFINLSEAKGLKEKLKMQGIELEVKPLPSTLKSFGVYDGLCLMGYGFEKKNIEPLRYFVSKEFQEKLIKKNYAPSIKIEIKDEIPAKLVEKTTVIPSPFEWDELRFLKESIEDVLIYGRDPETALMRAEARLKNVEK